MTDKMFLDRYFRAVHDKLEADALLFNRKLPHAGLSGSENEQVIGNVIRDFLPPRFGVEIGGLVIDRHGNISRQCDIVIYDAHSFPKYLRKVFPVELVYFVIEVKTSLNSQQTDIALEVLESLKKLDYYPALTPYWKTKTKENGLLHYPPNFSVFAYRTDTNTYETFAKWFPYECLSRNTQNGTGDGRSILVGALDQGIIQIGSGNSYVQRWLAEAGENSKHKALPSKAYDQDFLVDPAKSLFLYLENLWTMLWRHRIHPGFDIRTYLSEELDRVVEITPERMSEVLKKEKKSSGEGDVDGDSSRR